jgi:hypothetical protein
VEREVGRPRWRSNGGDPSRTSQIPWMAPSPACPHSSREALLCPGWRGKLAPSGRPCPGRRRPDERRGAGKTCEQGNQSWASCTASSRMGLWMASFEQSITPIGNVTCADSNMKQLMLDRYSYEQSMGKIKD